MYQGGYVQLMYAYGGCLNLETAETRGGNFAKIGVVWGLGPQMFEGPDIELNTRILKKDTDMCYDYACIQPVKLQ